ncbi:MAG: hypothetical protein LBF12_02900, partial [Christensenellaceae bacterium]|nr:hypothetical protein [Christensenellaceae bacterium]
MHVYENKSIKKDCTYCYVCENIWDPIKKRYYKPSNLVGSFNNDTRIFMPNYFLSGLIKHYNSKILSITDRERSIVELVYKKYGSGIIERLKNEDDKVGLVTGMSISTGPSIVFGTITERYEIDKKLTVAFGKKSADMILSLAWYITSEGCALSNNESWLTYVENPVGGGI